MTFEKTALHKKSTYRKELSFQRSESTAGFVQAIILLEEPEFLKILKCNSVENASAGFKFNCLDFF